MNLNKWCGRFFVGMAYVSFLIIIGWDKNWFTSTAGLLVGMFCTAPVLEGYIRYIIGKEND